MTDGRMDLRLRVAGERWRSSHPACAGGTPAAPEQPRYLPAIVSPPRGVRRVRLVMTASAAAVVALLVGLGFVVLGGRGSAPPTGSSAQVEPTSIRNVMWTVASVDGTAVRPAAVTLRTLVVAGPSIRIGLPCGITGNPVTVRAETMTIGPYRDACFGPELHPLDGEILRVLSGTVSWSLHSGTLTIAKAGTGTLTYLAVRVVDPDLLDDTRWRLVTVDGARPAPAPTPRYPGHLELAIPAHGRVTFDDGVNANAADVVRGTGTLDFIDVGGTLVGCAGPGCAQMAAIDRILRGKVGWFLQADRLTITKGGTGSLVYERLP